MSFDNGSYISTSVLAIWSQKRWNFKFKKTNFKMPVDNIKFQLNQFIQFVEPKCKSSPHL